MSARLEWFNEARYGMFIHWGPYSVGARGEWIANRERIGRDEYRRDYAAAWRAERYDPAAWAQLAVEAGMKYIVLTSRHHDGFCLWDTQTTEFSAARMGPGRDLVGPFVEAVRAAGLRVGLYYSVADWFHPDYPDPHARDWPTAWHDEAARQRFVAYYQAQLRELLSNYGRIDILWYDGCIPAPLDGQAANALARQLQPDILINDRNGEPFDFQCAEQSLNPRQGAWEACMTLNDNWGYHAGDNHWKTPQDVIRALATTARYAGNLLLNIGPRADGTVPEETVRILREAGRWLGRNGQWLAGSERSPFSWMMGSILTVKGQTVYIHIFAPPSQGTLTVAEIANRVRSVRQLEDGRPLSFEQTPEGRLHIHGVPTTPPAICHTLAVEVEGSPKSLRPQETFWIPQ